MYIGDEHSERVQDRKLKTGQYRLDTPFLNVQLHIDRDANARRSGFQSKLSTGTLLSVPFPRSEAYRAKGNHMRTLVDVYKRQAESSFRNRLSNMPDRL